MNTKNNNKKNWDMSSCIQFLAEIFGNKPSGLYFNIWTAPNNKSKFFKDIDKPVDYISKIVDKDIEIYIQTGMTDKNLGSKRRGKKKQIVGLPGLYMDIDVAGSAHKNKNLPPTFEAALDLVKGHGIDPTLVVKSGNGIHVWFLFKEVLIFDGEAEQNDAEMMNRRLQETIKQRAKENGWELDSTFDRTRLLRIVGTYNRKDPDHPILVKLIENTGVRYGSIDDFEDYIIAEDQLQKLSTVDEKLIASIADDLEINPSAVVTHDKLYELVKIDPKVAVTFDGQRKDFKKNSPSEHALSLANKAAQAGWSDQKICDLIVAFYRHNSNNPNFPNIDPLKPIKRPDYVAKTIAKAHNNRSNFDDKIAINVRDRDLEKVTRQIFSALNKTNEPPRLFNMQGNLIRLNPLEGERPRIDYLKKHDIRYEIVRRASCYKEKKEEGVKIKSKDYPSFDICEDVLATPAPLLPYLNSIVENPYYSAGFTAVVKTGYYKPACCFYHDPSGLILPPVPDQPDSADVCKAKDLIFDNLLCFHLYY